MQFDGQEENEKSIGGGLCILILLVNKKWATNFCVCKRVSTRSYEIPTVISTSLSATGNRRGNGYPRLHS